MRNLVSSAVPVEEPGAEGPSGSRPPTKSHKVLSSSAEVSFSFRVFLGQRLSRFTSSTSKDSFAVKVVTKVIGREYIGSIVCSMKGV